LARNCILCRSTPLCVWYAGISVIVTCVITQHKERTAKCRACTETVGDVAITVYCRPQRRGASSLESSRAVLHSVSLIRQRIVVLHVLSNLRECREFLYKTRQRHSESAYTPADTKHLSISKNALSRNVVKSNLQGAAK